jgi:hypothetical protein
MKETSRQPANEKCRRCGTPTTRIIHNEPNKGKTKWYAWFFQCPSCGWLYMPREAKRAFGVELQAKPALVPDKGIKPDSSALPSNYYSLIGRHGYSVPQTNLSPQFGKKDLDVRKVLPLRPPLKPVPVREFDGYSEHQTSPRYLSVPHETRRDLVSPAAVSSPCLEQARVVGGVERMRSSTENIVSAANPRRGTKSRALEAR